MLKVSNIAAGYGQTTILRDLSFHVREGEIVTIIGSNGAGKTTLLRTLSRLIAPSAGEVTFNGARIDQMSATEIVGQGLILVPEARQLFPLMTVRDNILMGCYHPKARKGAVDRFEKIIGIFPRVAERLIQLAGSLSGGEQQMVAIARGLMASPRLLMLDEPSLGLAPIMVKQMFDVIEQIRTDGTTVLLVEQKAFHALKIADRAYVVEHGSVVNENTGQGLMADPFVKRAYLGI